MKPTERYLALLSHRDGRLPHELILQVLDEQHTAGQVPELAPDEAAWADHRARSAPVAAPPAKREECPHGIGLCTVGCPSKQPAQPATVESHFPSGREAWLELPYSIRELFSDTAWISGYDYAGVRMAIARQEAEAAEPAVSVAPSHPFGGLCNCRSAQIHSLPHERGCPGYREIGLAVPVAGEPPRPGANQCAEHGGYGFVADCRTCQAVAAEAHSELKTAVVTVDAIARYIEERDAALAQAEALKVELRERDQREASLRDDVLEAQANAEARASDFQGQCALTVELRKELSDIREAFTSRCWDAGALVGKHLLGAVIAILQSQTHLRSQLREAQTRYDERDEELQCLDDVVVNLGGEREQGAASFMTATHERAERLERLLYSVIGDMGPELFSLSVFGDELFAFCKAVSAKRKAARDAVYEAEQKPLPEFAPYFLLEFNDLSGPAYVAKNYCLTTDAANAERFSTKSAAETARDAMPSPNRLAVTEHQDAPSPMAPAVGE